MIFPNFYPKNIFNTTTQRKRERKSQLNVIFQKASIKFLRIELCWLFLTSEDSQKLIFLDWREKEVKDTDFSTWQEIFLRWASSV